jgi:hypothetical protein
MDWAALGAFLSGAGAVLSAILSLRLVQKRAHADCLERIEEVKRTFREGLELGRE